MQVSAISANYSQNLRASMSSKGLLNTQDSDTSNETSCVDTANAKLINARIYRDINEWKSFCHKQILDGKLDIIA